MKWCKVNELGKEQNLMGNACICAEYRRKKSKSRGIQGPKGIENQGTMAVGADHILSVSEC